MTSLNPNYFILQPTPEWPPIVWSVVFAGIKFLQSWRLYLERRPVKLTPDKAQIKQGLNRSRVALTNRLNGEV